MQNYLTPAAIGGAGAILIEIVAKTIEYFIQRKKINVDDEAYLRTCLMQERQNLVKEVRAVADRCDALEKENARLNDELIAEKKAHFDEVQDYRQKYNNMERKVGNLEREVERLTKALAVYQ